MGMSREFAPPRWTRAERSTRFDRWVAARPQRLLVLWSLLFAIGALGVTLMVVAFFVAGWLFVLGAALVVPGWLTLAVDVAYVRPVWSAWRQSGAR